MIRLTEVRRSIRRDRLLAALAWFGSVIVAGVAGLGLVGMRYREFMDCSNPDLHQSANTELGWMVALAASLLPVAVAIGLTGRIRHRLTLLAVATAVVSLVVWQWALDKDCEWYSAGTSPLQLV